MSTGSRREPSRPGLPDWLTAVVVLVLLGSFVYNLVTYGPEGYPTAVIIGGLLGGYAGIDQLLKRRRSAAEQDDPGERP